MKLNMYTIKDQKAGIYHKPFFCINDQIALRAVSEVLADPTTEPARYPEDFVLFNVGTFDDSTGEIIQKEVSVMTRLSDMEIQTTGIGEKIAVDLDSHDGQ